MTVDPFLRTFGRRVATTRKALGLTQEELGARAELSPKYVSDIERGLTNVSLLVLRQLASGLETTAATLLDETNTEGRQILDMVTRRTESERRQMVRVMRAMFE